MKIIFSIKNIQRKVCIPQLIESRSAKASKVSSTTKFQTKRVSCKRISKSRNNKKKQKSGTKCSGSHLAALQGVRSSRSETKYLNDTNAQSFRQNNDNTMIQISITKMHLIIFWLLAQLLYQQFPYPQQLSSGNDCCIGHGLLSSDLGSTLHYLSQGLQKWVWCLNCLYSY